MAARFDPWSPAGQCEKENRSEGRKLKDYSRTGNGGSNNPTGSSAKSKGAMKKWVN